MTYSKTSNKEREDLFKNHQQRERTYSKSSNRERELFKNQQQREKELFKNQQQREREREREEATSVCVYMYSLQHSGSVLKG